MVEATPSIHPQPSAVIGALARQAAIKAIKHRLRAQGRKPNSVTLPELRHQANDYFAEHRAELREWVRSSPSLRELYDKEQRDRQRKLERNLNICTTREALRRKGFRCAKVMLKTPRWECEMIVGYARVSTDGQTLDAQQAALAAAGAQKVFAEKISGAVTERKALAKAIGALSAGDILLVTRLDRLARSTRDLLNVLDAVWKAGADFRSLADAWADTTTPHGRLMFTVLGGPAEFERELIRSRTDEGRKRAQARGVRFGRKPALTAHQRREALARREAGESLVEIGRSYNVSHSTISRL
jgi:DNA invertase Pin-like site-specific DNA recombinase